jgi:hypothetical protein
MAEGSFECGLGFSRSESRSLTGDYCAIHSIGRKLRLLLSTAKQVPGIYRDANGDEAFQLYLYEIETKRSTLLSDGRSRNTEPVWSNAGNQIVYSSSPAGAEGLVLRLLILLTNGQIDYWKNHPVLSQGV